MIVGPNGMPMAAAAQPQAMTTVAVPGPNGNLQLMHVPAGQMMMGPGGQMMMMGPNLQMPNANANQNLNMSQGSMVVMQGPNGQQFVVQNQPGVMVAGGGSVAGTMPTVG